MSSNLVRGSWMATMLVTVAISIAACGGKKPAATPPPAPAPAPAPAPSTPPQVVRETPPPQPPPPPPPRQTPETPRTPTEAEIFAGKTLAQINGERPLDEIFFAFDKSDLSDVARATLQKNASWLGKWTSTKITVEGHADARGTNEYNLALGERRASAVRDYLVNLGVDASRITTVSKGEEDPVCSEMSEECWARNRRARFEVTAK